MTNPFSVLLSLEHHQSVYILHLKKLQNGEDRNAEVIGRRTKMVEMGGTKLGQLLSNSDPWSGGACERMDCYTCHQGGSDRLEDCFRRNILYESRCVVCTEEQERKAEEENERAGSSKSKAKKGVDYMEKGVYVGESSRSLYERTREHLADANSDAPDSHMNKHWKDCHAEMQERPNFRFKIVKSFKDSLSRQVAESVRIDLRGEVVNSKTVYSRNRLPRLEIEKPEWERAEEERRKKIKEWEEKMSWERNCKEQREEIVENTSLETEEMMGETWRTGKVHRKREEQEVVEENPKKRLRRGQYGGNTDWGTAELSLEEESRGTWLRTGENSGDTARSVKISKQTKLQLWSGERLMSRDLVVEMARAAVEESELREEERTKAERTEVTPEESPKVLPVVVEQPKHQRARRAKKVVNKQETRPRDIMTTKPQDIRDMVRRNKEKAKRIRQEKKEQEARDERKRRATEQRRQLLEDIKTKTEHAKQRLKKNSRSWRRRKD